VSTEKAIASEWSVPHGKILAACEPWKSNEVPVERGHPHRPGHHVLGQAGAGAVLDPDLGILVHAAAVEVDMALDGKPASRLAPWPRRWAR